MSRLTTLSEVCEFVLDGTHGSPERTETGIPVLSALNVKDGRLSYETNRFTSDPEFKAFDRRIGLAKGDLLLTIVGTIGRAAIVEEVFPAVFQRSVAIIRPKQAKVDSRFLFHVTQSAAFLEQLDRATNKSAQAGVYLGKLKNTLLPLPPLEEQKRIAAILDQADELRRKRQHAIDRLNQLGQAIFHYMFGDPHTNPNGYPIMPLGQLVENEDGKRVPVKLADREQMHGEYPYYGASGVIDFVDDYLFDGERLLIGEDGANLLARSSPLAFMARGRYWVNNHAHVLAFNGKANLRYLEYYIEATDISNYVSGSAQPKLTQKQLNSIAVPTPPISAQELFAERLLAVDAEQARAVQSQKHLAELSASLQHRAFQGEL